MPNNKGSSDTKRLGQRKQPPVGNTAVNLSDSPAQTMATTAPRAKRSRSQAPDTNTTIPDPNTPATNEATHKKARTTPPATKSNTRRSGRTTAASSTHAATEVVPKKKRQTKAEMAAARAAAEAAKQQVEDNARKARQQLAQLNKEDAANCKTAATHIIRQLSDIKPQKTPNKEEYVRFMEISTSSESSEIDCDSDSKDKLEDKLEDELVKAEELEESDVDSTKMKNQSNYKALQKQQSQELKLAGGSKRQDNSGKKSTFATGLLPDWKSHSTGSKDTKALRSKVTVSEGGLNDDNAEALNPYLKAGENFVGYRGHEREL
ncbi:hypothetical protein BJ165DRAFT_1524121 [Panaeolus papilionaceus]|nr:hypothetical protein BJ165DRAFT_1524121 [Panaeolus papilionaceus]